MSANKKAQDGPVYLHGASPNAYFQINSPLPRPYIASPTGGMDMRKHERFRNCLILGSEKFGDFRKRIKLETLIVNKMSVKRAMPSRRCKYKRNR